MQLLNGHLIVPLSPQMKTLQRPEAVDRTHKLDFQENSSRINNLRRGQNDLALVTKEVGFAEVGFSLCLPSTLATSFFCYDELGHLT